MKAFVIGYAEQRKDAPGELLYAGDDRGEALNALETGGRGIVRTVMYQHPEPFKSRNFEPVEGEEADSIADLTLNLEVTPELQKSIDDALREIEAANELNEELNGKLVLLTAERDALKVQLTDLQEKHDQLKQQLEAKPVVNTAETPADRVADAPEAPKESDQLDLKATPKPDAKKK